MPNPQTTHEEGLGWGSGWVEGWAKREKMGDTL